MAFFELLADEQAEIINGGSYPKYCAPKPKHPAPMTHTYKPCLPVGCWGVPSPISNKTISVEALGLNIATATAGGAGSVAMAGNQATTIGISVNA